MSQEQNLTARKTSWKQNPEGVQRAIIDAATKAFAENGFTGTRLEDIAALTNTSKRMIYYYFGDKNGLYEKVLESAYSQLRQGEANLDIDHLSPIEALKSIVSIVFDHNRNHPDFVRILMIENIHHARTLSNSSFMDSMRNDAKSILNQIYDRGVEKNLFRPGLDPIKLRWMFSGLSFFNISNKPSFSALFGEELWSNENQQALKQELIDAILRYVLIDPLTYFSSNTGRRPPQMINPQIQEFLKVWDDKWSKLMPNATADDRRRRFEVIAHEMKLPTPDSVETDQVHWIESESGPVRVRIYRYKNDDKQPCLIYMHGGAWMQGSPETHADITARIAANCKQTVVSVDYAKAPERPFPAAINQVDAVALWIKDNAEQLNIDVDRITVGGDSAGGNLAAALTLDLRGSSLKLIGQLLIYPACDFDQSRPSYIENADGPLIQVSGMDKVNAMYCPNIKELSTNPRVAPLVAADHSNLPPAYVAVAQYDPLRDSGVAYAEALRESGVEVTMTSGEGLIHGYLRAMEFCEASAASLNDMCDWLNRINQSAIV